MVTMDKQISSDDLSLFRNYQPLIMGIRPQNMPQTSNSYYYPLNLWLLWVTNGNQGQTVIDLDYQLTIMGLTA